MTVSVGIDGRTYGASRIGLALLAVALLCSCSKKDAALPSDALASNGTAAANMSAAVPPAVPAGAVATTPAPATVPGFDPATAPIATPTLGAWPYFSLIDGYEPLSLKNFPGDASRQYNRDAAFDRYEFFDGVKLIPVEGRLYTVKAVGKGASFFQVQKTYEKLVHDLGGVTVWEGSGQTMVDAKIKFADQRHRANYNYDTEKMGIYMVRTPDRQIWVEVYKRWQDERRSFAEKVYSTRKPFAVGYFRLWQANRTLKRRGEALEAALNLTEIGVLLIDQAGDIAFANDAAERVLAAGAGIRRFGRSLRATDLAEGVRLQVVLNHVTALTQVRAGQAPAEQESASILALQRKVGPPLIVSLLAQQGGVAEPTDVAAIMFIVDPQLNTAKMLEPVCRLYQLSPVETKLVSYLAQGKSLTAASELMRVKEQTARSYMKQIFLKTGTNRQNELIVLMLSSVVRMRSGLSQRALGSSEIFAASHAMGM